MNMINRHGIGTNRPVTSDPTPLLLAAILVLGAMTLNGCGQVSHSVEDHIGRAQQAHAEGKLRTAIIEVKNALQQDASHAESRRLLGVYNLAAGDGTGAETELTRALELGSDPADVRLPLARARLMRNKIDPVLEATATLDEFPEAQHPEVLALRAQALLTRGEMAPARAAVQQALELAPKHAEALLVMAWIERLSDNPEQARQHLDAVLASDPEFDRAWELLGDMERDAGNFADAEIAYGKALETTRLPFTPRLKRALTRVFLQDYESADQDVQVLQKGAAQHPAVSYARGLIAFYQQRYDDARVDFEESLSRNADYMPALFYLGATQYALNNWRQAENYLARYVSRFPGNSEASRLLSMTRMQEGDTARAESALKAVLERNPDDSATLAMMSNLYLSQGRTDDALNHMRRVAELEPESAAPRAQIGITLMQQGQREEAFRELEAAIELNPGEMRQLEVALIMEHLRADEFQQALDAMERLRDRDDIHPAIYYNLKGMAHLGLGDVETAEAVFREGLEAAPDATPDLASNLAGILVRDGRLQEAQSLVSEALEKHPEQLGLLLTMARLRAAAQDTNGALALLQRAVAAHPAALPPRLALAQLNLQVNQPDEAIIILTPAQEQHGTSPAWLRLMSVALLQAGERQAAVDVLQQLKQQQPESADVHFMLGGALGDLGDHAQAIEVLEQGLRIDPEHFGARLALVQQLTVAGRFDEASARLEPLRSQYPDHSQVMARAAALASAQGQHQEAIRLFEQAVALYPNDRTLVGALAQAHQQAGDVASSVEILTRWLDNHPQDPHMRLLQANGYFVLGREEAAIQAYRQFLETTPDYAPALNNLALLLRASHSAEALRLTSRAAELAPHSSIILDTHGVVQMENGNPAGAVSTLRRAVELAPDTPSVRLNLAKALLADDQAAAAGEQLEKLMAEHPDTEQSREAATLLEQL